MHHHFSTYYDYDIEKKLREEDVQRHIDNEYWVEQIRATSPQPRRIVRRWRSFVATVIGLFF